MSADDKIRTTALVPFVVRLRGFRVVLYVAGDEHLFEREDAKALRDKLSEALEASNEVEAIKKRLGDGGWLA